MPFCYQIDSSLAMPCYYLFDNKLGHFDHSIVYCICSMFNFRLIFDNTVHLQSQTKNDLRVQTHISVYRSLSNKGTLYHVWIIKSCLCILYHSYTPDSCSIRTDTTTWCIFCSLNKLFSFAIHL